MLKIISTVDIKVLGDWIDNQIKQNNFYFNVGDRDSKLYRQGCNDQLLNLCHILDMTPNSINNTSEIEGWSK